MNEKPLERLNYYNGQRLQAADLKLEQDYHIRVRRWLNRSLYSAGIAEGLAVYAIKDQPRVRVTPGLAIDHLGREIILLEEAVIDVVDGFHGGGPYLTIRYREEVSGTGEASCNSNGHGERPAWSGPARILAEPVLELSTGVPNEASGRIPLAALRLTSKCDKIDAVDAGVRRYIGEGSANKVKQYALEGVRDIDGDNPGIILFHVRGRQPTSVTLFMQSQQFPTLHYTELGSHTHAMNVTLSGGDGAHSHELGSYTSESGGGHVHSLSPLISFASVTTEDFVTAAVRSASEALASIDVNGIYTRTEVPLGWGLVAAPMTRYTVTVLGNEQPPFVLPPQAVNASFSVGGGSHAHNYGSSAAKREYTISADIRSQHTHSFSSRSNDLAGVSDTTAGGNYTAKSGAPLTYVEGLEIEIDKHPVTVAALAQINAASAQGWARIGTGLGGDTDLFAATGTGAIRIDFLVPLSEGAHTLKLSVSRLKLNGRRNGGRIHFNLYVE